MSLNLARLSVPFTGLLALFVAFRTHDAISGLIVLLAFWLGFQAARVRKPKQRLAASSEEAEKE